jgi:hypothetical protein
VPVGVARHQTQRPRDQVGPPGAPPAHPSSPLDPGGERWPIFRTAGLADHPAAHSRSSQRDSAECHAPETRRTTTEGVVVREVMDYRKGGGNHF